MTAPALRLSGVRVPFGDRTGLPFVDLRAEPGERLVVVGSSGAGKTSLLRCIAGLSPITGGRVEVDGRDVSAEPPERRGTVYLHQAPVLFPHLDVAGNVGFPLRVRRVPVKEADERIRSALRAVRMERFASRRPHTLSGGQAHRVALARALAARPRVLLLDEPLASLDPALREEVREAILTVQREYSPALLMVTHDLDEAGRVADRIGVLIDGAIAQTASPRDLFAKPASLAIARFLGLPNEVRGVCRGGVFECAFGSLRSVDPPPDGPAVAIFPASAVRIGAPAAGGVPGRITGVRHLPNRAVALVGTEAGELIAAADPHDPPPIGDAIVELDQRRVHLFSLEPLPRPGLPATSRTTR